MRILLVTGGSSSEREISLISATNVRRALEANGHAVEWVDFTEGIGSLAAALARADVCFPIMHGKEGEDGTLYQFLKTAGTPYIGSDPVGAKTAFDKILFKEYCDAQGLPTAAWSVVTSKEDILGFGLPCVLKAAEGGSSHEVAPVRKPEDLESPRVEAIFRLPGRLFVERYLDGTEVTVGVLIDQALPVMEIVPPQDGWFDYQNKYSGKSREVAFAPSLSASLQEQVQRLAQRVHRDLRLGAFSRTDSIVIEGVPYLLEVNTPGGVGLTPQSLFPKAAAAAGIPFEALMERIIQSALPA